MVGRDRMRTLSCNGQKRARLLPRLRAWRERTWIAREAHIILKSDRWSVEEEDEVCPLALRHIEVALIQVMFR